MCDLIFLFYRKKKIQESTVLIITKNTAYNYKFMLSYSI